MKVFIGCSSNDKIDKFYLDETEKMCNLLCKYNYDLVYGAYNKSMMKVCFDTFTKNNRKVYGFNLNAYESIPNIIEEKFLTSFERLNGIYNASDLIIILPGGIGTLSELFSLIEENETNDKKIRVLIYNINHYYDNLIKFINEKNDSGFIYETQIKNINIVNSLSELEGELKWKI